MTVDEVRAAARLLLCGVCMAGRGHDCVLSDVELAAAPPGTERPVHAARYAAALPADQRGPFWSAAVDRFLGSGGADKDDAGDEDP